MRIAVAGGTGLTGRMVVECAELAGHQTVVLARSRGVDLAGGTGVAAALDGVDAVVDVTNVTTLSARRSTRFFTAVAANLRSAEQQVGVRHHVLLSIVGVDRAPYGYYAGKRAQERLVDDGPVPWTILRATQFHEMAQIVHASFHLGPVHLVPRMRIRPVAAREVAEQLVALAVGEPSGVVEIGGPREESLVAMVRAYDRRTAGRSWVPALSLPGAFGRAQRDGTLLPTGDALLGRQTFAEWLDGLERG